MNEFITNNEIKTLALNIIQSTKQVAKEYKRSDPIHGSLTSQLLLSSLKSDFELTVRAARWKTVLSEKNMADITLFDSSDLFPEDDEMITRVIAAGIVLPRILHSWPSDLAKRMGFLEQNANIVPGKTLTIVHPSLPLHATINIQGIDPRYPKSKIDQMLIKYIS